MAHFGSVSNWCDMETSTAVLGKHSPYEWLCGPVAEFLDHGDLDRRDGPKILTLLAEFFHEYSKLILHSQVTILTTLITVKFLNSQIPTEQETEDIRWQETVLSCI